MKEYLLSIDNGTQSIRAMIFDPRGNLIHKVKIPIEPYVSPHPGWAEQKIARRFHSYIAHNCYLAFI